MHNFNKVRKMSGGGNNPSPYGYGLFSWTNQNPSQFFGLQGNINMQGTNVAIPDENEPISIGGITNPIAFNPEELKKQEKYYEKQRKKQKSTDFVNGISDENKTKIANFVGNAAQVGTQSLNKDMYFTESGEMSHKIGNMLGEMPVFGNAFKVGLFGVSSIVKGLSSELGNFDYNRAVAERMGGSYNFDNIARASEVSGKKAFGKGLKEGKNIINTAEQQMLILSEIDLDNLNRQAMAANILQNSMNYNNVLNGGLDARYLRAAKLGIKLININRLKSFKTPQIVNINTKQVEEFKLGGTISEFIPIITESVDLFKDEVDEWIPIITEPVELFKEGGSIKESEELVKLEETNLKNVIPEGALHKNKHHIENTEGLTLKGIPVIDNDGEQQAEIELDEIIFTLEVTKKLEELHKIYKEGSNKERDEAATEAGKLLVQEILYNTDDRTGLIAKCEKGGKL